MDNSPSLPAARGFAWIVQSWFLIRLQTGRLLLIALLMQIILGLTQLPLLSFLVILAVPGLNAGILEAFHVTGQGIRPPPGVLFKPLTTSGSSGRLLALGALVFLIAVLLISFLLPGGESAPDPETLARIQQGDLDAVAELDVAYIKGMFLAFMIAMAVSATLSFFSIPLVWFKGRKLLPAVLEGFRGMMKNWKAMLTLGLGLGLCSLPFGLATGLLFGLTGGNEIVSFLVMGLIMLILLLYQVLIFGTQYCAAREIFDFAPGSEPPKKEDEAQLVV